MKVNKSVEFTTEEVEKIKSEALCKAAETVIGKPSEGEMFKVEDLPWLYKASKVSIVAKDAEKAQEGTEA